MISFLKYAIYILMRAYLGLIVLNIFQSWFPGLQRFGFFRILRKIADAYMQPFHGALVLGMFDFTPIIGIILYEGIINAYVFLIS